MQVTSKLSRFMGMAAVAVTLAGLSLAAQAESWRGWNIHPPGYPNSVALESFAQQVTENTDGRLELKVYNNGVLGSQPDAIQQVRHGALQFANFNMGPMGPIVPATSVLSLPFIFNSVDDMYRLMDGEIGDRMADALAEKGLIALAWYGSGARSFYTTVHAIEEPDDVKGLKFRVMNNDLYVDMVAALGGNATPMAYSAVYQSLKTGVIDGAENNYPSFESAGHYEVAKYYSLTQHLILPECVCIAKSSWEELSDTDQQIVREAALASAKKQRKLWAEKVAASREKVLKAGVKINKIEDKSAFQAKMKPVYEQFLSEYPDLEPLVRAVQDAQ